MVSPAVYHNGRQVAYALGYYSKWAELPLYLFYLFYMPYTLDINDVIYEYDEIPIICNN